MPDLPAELVAALPDAIDQARLELRPGDPDEVLSALTTLARRRGFLLPDELALEIDVELMAAWPRDLWRKAFRTIWETFAYRRMPEVCDFHQHIAAELAARRSRLDRLQTLRLKLETVRLRAQWDEETRRRRGR
jgi:hypothetical protein